jgi:competence protein ComEC
VRPRPVTLFVLLFGAGLATGLARFHPLGAGILAAILAVVVRRSDHVLLPIAFLLGLAHAWVASQATSLTCAARLRAGAQTISVVLLDSGRSGVVSARIPGVRCTGAIPVRWPARPTVSAGRTVRIDGRWIAEQGWGGRPAGTFVVKRLLDVGGRPALSARLRGWITETAEARFGARASLVDALVLGRRGAMDPELKDAFARSGLVHLLSISGFHVGLIMAWLVLLFRAMRVPRVRAQALGAIAAAGYVAFLGWPAPATRAAALGLLLAFCFWRQRRVQPVPLLAMTCLAALLLDPWAIRDLGGWLSAASLWGATMLSRWSDRAVSKATWTRTLFGSVGATLAAAPITAFALGTVALAGIVLNFAGIPLAALAVPAILLTLICAAVVPPLADMMAAGSGLVLGALERLAWYGARIPGGSITMDPGPWPLLFWLVTLAATMWVLSGGMVLRTVRIRAALALAALCWLWVALFQVRTRVEGRGRLSLFFLRIGQGDAAVIRTPRGKWVLVDAGPAGSGRDAGRRVVAPFLLRHGARWLSTAVVSHAHADHLGGLGSVLERVPVSGIIEPGVPVRDSLYLAMLDRVEASGAAWHPGRRGDTWMTDGVRFSILHPDTAWAGWGEDLNEDSVVLLVEYGRFRALFTGDAGAPVETLLRGRIGKVDLLKVAHHGSRTATGEALLRELDPTAAVVSVGINRYGHPSPDALRRIAAAGVELWRTDRDGTVEARTDGSTVWMRGDGRRRTFTVH